MTHGGDVLRLFRLEVIQVLVRGVAGMDLVLDAVEAGHHHGGERKVRIVARVREAHFDTARLRVGNPGNTNRCRPVARGVREHDGSLESGYQALVAVGSSVREGIDGLRVLDDATDVVQRGLGESAVLVTGTQSLA